MDKKKAFEIAIDTLMVFSWAFVFLGFIIGLYIFAPFGLISGICAAFLATTPGLLCILAVNLFFLQKDKLEELQKQTQILEKIYNKFDKN